MTALLDRLRRDASVVKLGDWFIANGASEASVRGMEQEFVSMLWWFKHDVRGERERRRRLARRARDLAHRLDRDVDGRQLTIDELLDRPGEYRIAWAFGQIREFPRPTIARALIEAAEQLEQNPSWLRHKPKMPRDLVLAVTDVIDRRLRAVAACGGTVRRKRPIAAIAAISSVLHGQRVTPIQVRHFVNRAISAKRKLKNGTDR